MTQQTENHPARCSERNRDAARVLKTPVPRATLAQGCAGKLGRAKENSGERIRSEWRGFQGYDVFDVARCGASYTRVRA